MKLTNFALSTALTSLAILAVVSVEAIANSSTASYQFTQESETFQPQGRAESILLSSDDDNDENGVSSFLSQCRNQGVVNGRTWQGVVCNNITLGPLNLNGFSISRTVLNNSQLNGVTLVGANLTRIFLSGATLTNVNLKGAVLDNVIFTNATLQNVDLTGVNQTAVNWSNTQWINVKRTRGSTPWSNLRNTSCNPTEDSQVEICFTTTRP
ncbi:MAG: pentapeptide repeat-containing protein [Leptolyngbyaceae cyanobacterium SM1_1_3]|nr:pentapeptide repeat-containing protein [Leptolyngbyaceae cyanobacterium SM1_1_3]NJN01797.1 pentapeptide repeat-containing protein [Leptolyngbyaceae cyanobacterium RM1_1_2]NJO11335.1 pentapeptide repeat-containing protein [Leptolyngbyaceae cyanobacterium SL_1_1]